MYVIGLTGGVGSGKTVAAGRLADIADAELLIADDLGHLVMEKGKKGYQEIVGTFGSNILDGQGEIDRRKLSELVFGDSKQLEKLNRIIHPAVKSYLKDYIDKRRAQEGILVLETAIMFETGCDELCDEVWYVYVPPEIRIERLAAGRGYPEGKSQAIMERQLAEDEFRKRCRHELWNGGSMEELEEGIRKLLKTKA
ncbi:MAG: dephospho-CoA kinase [Lachnospiraceae bacterium]|nr:dephospho-CoA kinase [Lachnospiraceae bacterium]